MIDIQKRIFITGATGFIGSNLARKLVSLGASDIHILCRPESDTSRIIDILDRVTSHYFSLEDRDEVFSHIREISPQYVYHIAASGTAVGRVPLDMGDLLRLNSMTSAYLMDACLDTGVCEAFINTGSSSEYGHKDTPMSENDILEPNNPYAISKSVSTHYATYLGKQKGFPIATYRVFAAYGPYEDAKRLIPTLLSAYRENRIPKLSSPDSVRDFIHIDDIVSAYLMADKAIKHPGDIINLGTGIQHSIADVVRILQKIFMTDLSPEYGGVAMNQYEPKVWVSNPEKMKQIFSITPYSLEDGLQSTLQWMKKSL